MVILADIEVGQIYEKTINVIDKEYIKSLLMDEKIVEYISILRTQFSPQMTESHFFKIFFDALYKLNITGEHHTIFKDCKECYLILWENKKYKYEFQYNYRKLQEDLDTYNMKQGGMSMLESVHKLIDIFVGLLS